MKKRFVMLLTLSIMTSALCACELPFELPFGNKENQVEEEGTQDQTSCPTLHTTSVGSTINVLDIVALDPTKTISQFAFVDALGASSENFEAKEAGQFPLTVMIVYADGSQFMQAMTMEVTGPTITVPDNIAAWLTDSDVDGIVTSGTNTFTVKNSIYNTDDSAISSELTINGNSSASFTFKLNGQSYIGSILTSNGTKPVDATMDFALSMMDMAAEMAGATDDAQQMRIITEVLRTVMSNPTTSDSGYTVYDVDGTAYPVQLIYNTLDFSSITEDAADKITYPIGYGFEAGGNFVNIYATNTSVAVEEAAPTEGLIDITDTVKTKEDLVKELKKYLTKDNKKKFEEMKTYYAGVTLEEDAFNSIINGIVIGDGSSFVTTPQPEVQAPVVETQPQAQAPTTTSTEQSNEVAHKDYTNESVGVKNGDYKKNNKSFYSMPETSKNMFRRFLYQVIGAGSEEPQTVWVGGYYPDAEKGSVYYADILGSTNSKGQTSTNVSNSNTQSSETKVTVKFGNSSYVFKETSGAVFTTVTGLPVYNLLNNDAVKSLYVHTWTKEELDTYLNTAYLFNGQSFSVNAVVTGSTAQGYSYVTYGFRTDDAIYYVCTAISVDGGYIMLVPRYAANPVRTTDVTVDTIMGVMNTVKKG